MPQLTNEHIDYISKDLGYRGIIVDSVHEELVDHICSAVEAEMNKGRRFIEAYHQVLADFGHTNGLISTQKQIIHSENNTPKLMLRNYLTIAFRNLSKQRFYTFINISGLAIGIAACLIITLFVLHELSYDKHFKNADRIYRLHSEVMFNGNHHNLAVAPAPAAATLVADFPEVEASAHFRKWGPMLVKAEQDKENIRQQNIVYGSQGFFKVFSVPLVSGDPNSALTAPRTLVMSKSMVDKYFGSEDPIGKTLIVDNHDSYKVTGVFEDLPVTSHFQLDFILSMEGLEESKTPNWLSNNFQTYILLREGAKPADLEAKFPKMIETYVGPQAVAAFGNDFTMEKFYAAGNKFIFSLFPLTKIHLHSNLVGEMDPNGDITYVYLFAAVALFILAIACINFMNLSTARSANRAKEVGVRKVLGSMRSHLVRQFLTESVLLSLCSFILALILVVLALPYFNILSGKMLSIPFGDPMFIGIIALATLIVGLLAGTYPSVFLSGFKPVNVLKGRVALGMKSGVVRSTLVVFQFMISIFLIIGTIAVQKQLSFIQNTKLGFEKDQVIILHDTYVLGPQTEAFKNEMLRNNIVLSASSSGYLPIAGWGRSDTTFWPEGSQPSDENLTSMQYWSVDYDYLKTLGMKIREGRGFSHEFPSDSSAIILNEAAVKKFGFEQPIGQKISTFQFNGGNVDPSKIDSYTVIGVVENFHFESLRDNIGPLSLILNDANWAMTFRFESGNTKEVIALLEKNWKAMAPGQPFQYTFLDEAFGNMYSSEERLGTIFAVFAGLAIIIACLGLFALTSFTAEQRTKEIGIRKVLGASVSSIIMLLSREFGKLIIIAFVLAAPISWFAVDWWLQNYTYKTEVGVVIYLLAGGAAFIVAWLTMSFQSLKAATNDPVKSLRSE